MISIEAKRAIGIFEAATECMRHYLEVSLEIAQRDIKAFTKLFKENAELMNRLEDFVDTMKERLNQFQISHRIDEKYGKREIALDKLLFPTEEELKLGARLHEPEDDPDEVNGGQVVCLDYHRVDDEIDPKKFPVSFSEVVEVKEHARGCEEISYNSNTDSVALTFFEQIGNRRGLKLRSLKDKTELTTYVDNSFEPRYAFAPTDTTRVFSSKNSALVIRNTEQVNGLFKKGADASNAQSWDIPIFNRAKSFVDRPFLASTNFYCRPSINNGQLELSISDFTTTNALKIAIPEIKAKSENDKDAISTFTIVTQSSGSVVIILSKTGVLVLKKADNSTALAKLELPNKDSDYLDAFYIDLLKKVFVLRRQNQGFFIERVTVSPDYSTLTFDNKTIEVAKDELPQNAKKAKLGVIAEGQDKLIYFIALPESGLVINGQSIGTAKSTWYSPFTLVDPSAAYVSEMKLSASLDALATTICSTATTPDKIFSTLVFLRAK